MDGVLPPDERRLDLVLGPLELLLGHGLALDALDLVHDSLLERLGSLAGQRRPGEPEEIWIKGEIGVIPGHVQGHASFVDQAAVEPRGPPVLKNARQ